MKRSCFIALCYVLLLFLQGCKCNHKKQNENTTSRIVYDIRNDLQPKRLTIAMWDFSWIYMHYEVGAFENFGKVIDELKERGFNTVRIDAFPMIIGKLESEQDLVTFEGDSLRNWGASDINRKHAIINELIEFISLAKQKGIYIILSTWNRSCLEYPDLRSACSNHTDYWQAWEHTLNILEKYHLLDQVLYVDLDQEFPYFSPFNSEINRLSEQKDPRRSDMEQAGTVQSEFGWNQQQLDYVKDYLESSLKHFQNLYPKLRFTFSLTNFWKEIRSLHIKYFDILELHFWMSSMDRFENRTNFGQLKKDRGEYDYSNYMGRINTAMKSIRPMLLKEMHNQLQFAKEWSEEIASPLTTTEAWGPWWHMDHPDLDWQWLYDWCELCMGLSSDYGFWGTTPWNYSHPYWNNWKNIRWYQQVNNKFLNN